MNLLQQVRNAIAISMANCFPRLGIFNRLRLRILKLGGHIQMSDLGSDRYTAFWVLEEFKGW
jgi:hypothetical protein